MIPPSRNVSVLLGLDLWHVVMQLALLKLLDFLIIAGFVGLPSWFCLPKPWLVIGVMVIICSPVLFMSV